MDIDIFNSFLRDIDDMETVDNFMNVKLLQRKICVNNKATTILPKVRRKHFNPMQELNECEFKEKYRFSKENMMKLIEVIRDDLEVERPPGMGGTSNQVPIDQQVLVAIRQWGLNEAPELVAEIHDITIHTLDKICRRVALAFASKASRYIRMPVTLAEKEQVTNNFHAIAGFPQVIGAVACQSLHIRKVAKTDQPLASTQSECSINIQTISDGSFKIRDFDYRLRPLSKANRDHQIFPETRIKERFEQNEFRGRLLLGDSNYTCTSYLYTPLLHVITPKDEAFNKAHAATLASVKTSQRLWRQRFRIIQDYMTCYSFSGAKHLIVALAVLHNIAIDLNDSCKEFEDSFGHCEALEEVSSHRDEICEENGVESRSAFISKYF